MDGWCKECGALYFERKHERWCSYYMTPTPGDKQLTEIELYDISFVEEPISPEYTVKVIK